MNYLDFFEATILNNGATFNNFTRELNPTKGYFVSLPKHEQRIEIDNFSIQHVKDFINCNNDVLNEHNFVGSWIDNGIVYLDVTQQFQDKRQAITIGYSRGQKAIFDANLGVVIELPSSQTSGTITQQRGHLTQIIDKLCI